MAEGLGSVFAPIRSWSAHGSATRSGPPAAKSARAGMLASPSDPNPPVPASPRCLLRSKPSSISTPACAGSATPPSARGSAKPSKQLFRGGRLLLVAPTGGGKSLSYQLPALLLPGTSLVVSPLVVPDARSGRGARGARRAGDVSRGDARARRDGAPARARRARRAPLAVRRARSGSPRRPFAACCAGSRVRSSRSTRRTASANGATTSGPIISRSAACWRSCRAHACSPARPPRRRSCATRSWRGSGCLPIRPSSCAASRGRISRSRRAR